MIIKHSNAPINSVYDKEKKEWVKLPEEKEEKVKPVEEKEKPEIKEK